MLTEKQYNIICGKMLGGNATPEDGRSLLEVLTVMESLLDEADSHDTFGTEGWRRELGWEE